MSQHERYCIECNGTNGGHFSTCSRYPKKETPIDKKFCEKPSALSALDEPEYTGGSVSYYKVCIENPTSKGADSYTAECNDIIEALGMNYAEGNAFKALWRMCAARQGRSKKGYTDGVYDAEKVVFFGERLILQQKALAKD